MRRSGTFATSLLLTSSSLSVMFCARPSRARCNADSAFARFPPPHMTRRSSIRVSPFAQFGAEFLERDVRKPARCVLGDCLLLLKSLSVPSARKFLDDPRRFAAMQIERGVEITVFGDRSKPFIRTNMLGQLPTQKITERAPG